MTILVYNQKTTGLYDFKRSPKDSAQPHVVQIGAVMFNSKWEEVGNFVTLIRPEGWASNASAMKKHGITERRCELYGVRSKAALAYFMDLVRAARELASYNLAFDMAVTHAELLRIGAKPEDWVRGGLKRTSIMELAAQKWSNGRSLKLSDAHRHATGIPYDGGDNALKEARAAARILKEIRRA